MAKPERFFITSSTDGDVYLSCPDCSVEHEISPEHTLGDLLAMAKAHCDERHPGVVARSLAWRDGPPS